MVKAKSSRWERLLSAIAPAWMLERILARLRAERFERSEPYVRKRGPRTLRRVGNMLDRDPLRASPRDRRLPLYRRPQ